MLEQLLEISRKAVESSLQIQQALFKQVTQDSASMSPTGLTEDWGGSIRKRWIELTLDALNKHRESIDSTYRAGIQTVEQAIRASEAKSSEEGVRGAEDVWHKVFDTMKKQSETQIAEFQKLAEKSFEMARKPAA